jgi:hypothetical protein
MRLTRKRTVAPVNKEKEFAAPLFKNSLLAWHARRKAQGAGPCTTSPKASSQPVLG